MKSLNFSLESTRKVCLQKIFFILSLLWTLNAPAQSLLNHKVIDFGAETFLETNSALSIEQIRGDNLQWQPASTLFFGYRPYCVWTRFAISKTVREEMLASKIPWTYWLEYSRVYSLSYFSPPKYQIKQGGLTHLDQKTDFLSGISFAAQPEAGFHYFRACGNGKLSADFKLLPQPEYFSSALSQRLLQTLTLGAIFVMILYNLFMFFALRDTAHLFYCFYMFTLMSLIDSFYPFFHNFASILKRGEFAHRHLNISVTLLGITLLLFFQKDVQLRQHSLKLYRFCFAVIIISLTLFGMSILPLVFPLIKFPGWFDRAVNFSVTVPTAFIPILILGTNIYLLPRSREARFFFASFAFVLVSLTSTQLWFHHVVDGFVWLEIFYATCIMQGVLFSVGLADRLNTLRKKQAELEKSRLEAEKRAQEEQRKQEIATLQAAILQKDISASEMVQRALLPAKLEVAGFEMSSWYHPASKLGGDWYDYHYDEKNKVLYIFVGDVTGHGIPSSLITAVAFGSLHTSNRVFELPQFTENESLTPAMRLNLLAETLNKVIYSAGERSQRLMTMAFIAIDAKSGDLWLLNAAHNFPFFVKSEGGAVKAIALGGYRLGYCEDATFEVRNEKLQIGDILFLYTDGLVENKGKDGTLISQRNLRSLLSDGSGKTCVEVVKLVQETAETLWNGVDVDDDAMMLAVRLNHSAT